MTAAAEKPTLAGLGPLAERYWLVTRPTSHGILFYRELGAGYGGGVFGGEAAATRYATAESAHEAILRLNIEPAAVLARVTHRCCVTPHIETFTCDGSGGSYALEWCSVCGSMRFEEFVAATGLERKFCEWNAPTAPEPGRLTSILRALVGTLPKCAERGCTALALRTGAPQGQYIWCDEHGTDAYVIYPGTVHESRYPMPGASIPDAPWAEPLRAAIAASKGGKP